MKRKRAMSVVVVVICCLLTGCWDKKEINDLAIVDAIGVDIDPDSGERLVYFQIVNPPGVGGKSGESSKASVYTYKMSSIDSVSGFTVFANKQIPRMIFSNDVQLYIMTLRYSQKYYREILDFIESNPTRRSTGYFVATDAPIDTIMNTIVPVERVPGRAMRSMIELQQKVSGVYGKHIRARDAINGLSRNRPIVIPFVSVMNDKVNPQFAKLEAINAPYKSVVFDGGAVYVKDRLTGKIDYETNNLSNLLSGDADRYLLNYSDGEGGIEVMLEDPIIDRKLAIAGDTPILSLNINASLRIYLDNRTKDSDYFDVHEIERLMTKEFEKRCLKLVQLTRKKSWDLLGIQDQIDRKRSKVWSGYKTDSNAWKKTDVHISADFKVKWLGRTKSSYGRSESK
ncbi:Ger(x)C family spore germination protein [Paenibacillus glycinis]|uniref:Ger(X)C family spore germination protein n=1 Tax=Paenibacillus glycinis TaxID=2697035 RepID=A0ABW9XKG1_9BACL|nr:Ger(x)C family spore germination protein [Paenibacillus glycinis]NBD23087.1 Ger(x)C family spore germination protein [Paenibacillus glycinis]